MNQTELLVPPEKAGMRIDVVASELSGLTRSRIQRLIEEGLVRVNGSEVRRNYRAQHNDAIAISSPEQTGVLTPEDIRIEVMHQDEFLIVVNKPPGLVVHPAAGHRDGTLMNAIARRAPKMASAGAPLRPGVVHRLDKDTSGVMVVALDDSAYYNLVEQFRKRTITRKYQALVYGSLKAETGKISSMIGRSASDRKKMSTKTRQGKEAVTTWRALERYPSATLVEAVLGTGRTHQIRVHFASIGHPVLGDETYGRKMTVELGTGKVRFSRQMLHAEVLGFVHPATGRYMEFSSKPPADMEEAIAALRDRT
ncbi:MAG: RluA family pseudouridine synthase [Nitrospiraceae bacterium]|nr:RluA family pseudouridine synthase [Nitrospiraceae bacterium]